MLAIFRMVRAVTKDDDDDDDIDEDIDYFKYILNIDEMSLFKMSNLLSVC